VSATLVAIIDGSLVARFVSLDSEQDGAQRLFDDAKQLRDAAQLRAGQAKAELFDWEIDNFRRRCPERLAHGASDMAQLDDYLVLDGNFRSSPAICALNKSLRLSGRQEIAVGRHKESAIAVQVVGYQKVAGCSGRVEVVATTHSLTVEEVLFLSHWGSDARACAGSPDTTSSTGKKVLAIARAGLVLRSSSASPRDRKSAIEVVEGALRAVAKVDDEDLGEPIEPRWPREAAVRLAVSLDPAGVDGKDFAARLPGT
jgi:DNA helicase II / ATP-dependent DNA helicase PcrA